MTILYGSRTKADILFQDEFDVIMARTDKVKLVNVLSEEEAEGCENGFITAELIRKYAGEGTYSIFAAGSQGMYQFLDGEAEKLGLIKKYYRKELYDNIGQPWNYPGYPMEAKDKVFNLKSCWNASFPIDSRPSGKISSNISSQPANASVPMVLSPDPNVTFVRISQPEKAL